MKDIERLKKLSAEAAADFISSGMVIGLGTGSTVFYLFRKIAELIENGTLRDIAAIPSSLATEREAMRHQIPLISLDLSPGIDLTIDGADEVDPRLDLIKGRGGALLREKVLIQASLRTIIIVDEGKMSDRLGRKCPVPVEVLPFAWKPVSLYLASLGGKAAIRLTPEGRFFLTDQGNYIIDCTFSPDMSPEQLAVKMDGYAGIVEHGLFLSMATDVIAAGEKGIEHLTRPS